MDKVIKLQDSTGTNTLLPWADFMGIDTSNLIASGSGVSTYTATEDCFLSFTSSQTDAPRIKIGGVTVFKGYSSGNSGCILLKKGQTATSHYGGGELSTNMTYSIYGIKR